MKILYSSSRLSENTELAATKNLHRRMKHHVAGWRFFCFAGGSNVHDEIVDFVEAECVHHFLVHMVDRQQLMIRVELNDPTGNIELDSPAFVNNQANQLVRAGIKADALFH